MMLPLVGCAGQEHTAVKQEPLQETTEASNESSYVIKLVDNDLIVETQVSQVSQPSHFGIEIAPIRPM